MTDPHRHAELDLLPVGVAHVDATGTVVLANRTLAEMLGVPVDEIVGRSLFEFAVGDLDRYAAMLEFGTGYHGDLMGPLSVEYRHADGSVHDSSLWARNHLGDPDIAAFACTFVPASAESGVRAGLMSVAEGEPVEATLGLLAKAIEGNPLSARGCCLVRDDAGRRLAADDALTDPVRAALAKSGRWWRTVRGGELLTCDDTRAGDDADRLLAAAGVAAWWAAPCRGGDDAEAAVVVLRPVPGPMSPNQREHLEQVATTASLAFERASMQARLAHAAFHDPLTGLANRGRFFHRDGDGLPLGAALLSIDLDHFKPVNDSLGHAAGDLVLVTVAERIRRAVRPTDRITRFGGDEFVVECPGAGTEEEAVAIAERIITAIREPIHLDTACVTVEASIGIALAGEGSSVDEVLDRSDAALLAAKAAGKGRWSLSR
ncbi:MAG: diguanylate cyclase [Acidimicrobiia bacterium]